MIKMVQLHIVTFIKRYFKRLTPKVFRIIFHNFIRLKQHFKLNLIMKQIFLLVAGTIIMFQLNAQTPSDCTIPWILEQEYSIDVIDLAYQRMYDIHSPDTIFIDLPTIYRDTIWHGLAAIFKAFQIPERDTIFDIYCVHRSLSYFMLGYYITIKIDTNYEWTSAWLHSNITTGYTELDDLLSHYGFNLWGNVTITNFVYLVTDQIINTRALCDSLEKFEGIILAIQGGYGGDGSYIKYNKTGNDQFYDFSMGWGDCWAGCINRYIWHFKVNYEDCSVEYLGSEAYLWNTIFPEQTNCNITNINLLNSNPGIKVFPNPTNGKFAIESEGIEKIKVYNFVGELIKELSGNNKNEIDLSDCEPGIYLVKIITQYGFTMRKIIKN